MCACVCVCVCVRVCVCVCVLRFFTILVFLLHCMLSHLFCIVIWVDPSPQEQYAFIHDALCDYLTCGDTSIPAYQLRGEMEEMEKVDNNTRISGFESQFKVQNANSCGCSCTDDLVCRPLLTRGYLSQNTALITSPAVA